MKLEKLFEVWNSLEGFTCYDRSNRLYGCEYVTFSSYTLNATELFAGFEN